MFGRSTDHMTLDQINRALAHYRNMPPGKMTPWDADRERELIEAKRRITGADRSRYTWWR